MKTVKVKPVKSATQKKIHLKPTKLDVNKAYLKTHGHLGRMAIYGLDEFTESLIDYYWSNTQDVIYFTDENPGIIENLTRKMGERPNSIHRWMNIDTESFVSYPMVSVVVIAKHYIPSIKKRANPYKIKYITLGEPKVLMKEF